jgi:hypothetical protein
MPLDLGCSWRAPDRNNAMSTCTAVIEARRLRWRPRSGISTCSLLPSTAAWADKVYGYNRRALAEATIGRFKRVIGDGLRSRTDQRQATEMTVAVAVLNRMLELGRPKSVRIARTQAGQAHCLRLLICASRSLAGIEAMAMLAKGQVRTTPANDILTQRAFVHEVFALVA